MLGYKLEKQFRLKNYDYSSSGYYFVTICTANRKHFFGEVKDQKMNLTTLGKMVQKCWVDIPNHFSYTRLDTYVVMPNHLHGIIIIDRCRRDRMNLGRDGIYSIPTGLLPHDPFDKSRMVEKKIVELQPQKKSLSIIVRVFKAAVTKWSRENDWEYRVWQSRFHDRIIRDEDELDRIREYIENNSLNWDEDRNNLDG
ncbi:transposase [Candidatus Dojkabacteria bacterium]|nr:transposase [Candidatus Dojkabacteria bacterium]